MTSSSNDIRVDQLTGNIGAIISGVDIAADVAPDAIATVRQALLDHGVVYFRGQDITSEQFWSFMEQFGVPQREESTGSDKDTAKDLLTSDLSMSRKSTAVWHADTTSLARPPIATALRAIEVPAFGGDTCWSSMYAAWDALTPRMQQMLDGLTAVHSIQSTYDRMGEHSGRYESAYSARHAGQQVHPVVLTHPETGRKALYVSEAFVTRIVELDRLESQAILTFLFRHVERPDFIARWHWQAGDLALWDNRSTLHYAVNDYSATRRMQRIVLAGVRPGEEKSAFRARSETLAAQTA